MYLSVQAEIPVAAAVLSAVNPDFFFPSAKRFECPDADDGSEMLQEDGWSIGSVPRMCF